MHILMLSDVYFPRINGVSTSIQTFAQAFLNVGCRVSLIAPEYPDEHSAEFEIIRIRSRGLPFDPEDRLMSLREIKRLAPTLKAREIDLLHIQTPFVAHYAGVYLRRALGAKTVVSYHTYFEAYFEKYLPWAPRGWLRSVARRYSRTQCNEVDGVISPSRPMLERLREYGVTQQAAVIPTGLPAETFAPVEDRGFRARHALASDAFLLLYVGRVAHEKNIDLLIDMFCAVSGQIEDAVLLIAGEGPALASLRRRAARQINAERVRFIGYLDRTTELPECYQACDLFVFGSQTETQGLVLLEAMANGLPVVSTASMGSLDVLSEGEGCQIVPADPEVFAERVMSLHANEALRMTLSERALRYARTWAAENKAREMLDFYDHVLSGAVAQAAQARALGAEPLEASD